MSYKGGVKRIIGLHPTGVSYALARLFSGRPIDEIVKIADRDFSPEVKKVSGGEKTIFFIAPDTNVAEQIASDCEFFIGDTDAHLSEGALPTAVCRFFGWDVLPFDGLSPSREISAARNVTLAHLLSGKPSIVVATPEALMQRIVRPEIFNASRVMIREKDPVDRDTLVRVLDAAGFVRATVVEELGQFAVRGSVIDLFPVGIGSPIRIELFDDAISSLRPFDPGTQRTRALRGRTFSELEILPVSEIFLPGTSLGEIYCGSQNDLEQVRRAVTRIRSRGVELGVPIRTLDALEDVILTGGLWPGLEHLLPLVQPELTSIWEYLPGGCDVVVCDEAATISACDRFCDLVNERVTKAIDQSQLAPIPEALFVSAEEVNSRVHQLAQLYFENLDLVSLEDGAFRAVPEGGEGERVRLSQGLRLELDDLSGLRRDLQKSRHEELPLKPLAQFIQDASSHGTDILIAVAHRPRATRLREILANYGIALEEFEGSFREWSRWRRDSAESVNNSGVVSFSLSYLSGSVRSATEHFTIIADHEIFPELSRRKPNRASTNVRRFLGSVSQIKEDDIVVHIDHGIAIYRGLKQISIDGKPGDFLLLEYADEARLFLPVENIGKIQKYVGADGAKPPLSKLGSKNWATTKEKVRRQIVELAGQLLNLYADRELTTGFTYGPVDEDDYRFAETFPFQETPDQEKAIAEVLADMDRARPMDRLVCGDVGFGKTEVALRAAFKAVNNGKQVAVLVPTTILADQHYSTFQSRFREFPFKVGCVSRFYPPQENRTTLEKVARGEIDVVIGTHRLLQRDVAFRDLGLIIVDEEHRFGVADKERLKRVRREVDVLTLTATPIPRTLYMSLFDIRDLSVIETPPTDRQVIRTYLAPYQGEIVKEAIQRELGRSGQVFLIHNRVSNISLIADEVKELVPEARVVFAHGQMHEDELERVMHSFICHEADVLVSTTIVESGLDIPNANTIIIRDADKLGLAELYQLRGRVGRSSRRAYAYLLISDTKTLGAEAKKRLQVLQSLDDLGQGFRLALQDMEIRGAGNLLGKDQSGKIELVGFELYSKILKEAVRELRSRREKFGATETAASVPLELLIDPEINVGFPVHIPEFYVPDVEERLLLYQRLVDIHDRGEADEMREEIEDRFGHLPDEVSVLLELMVFRSVLRRIGITAANFRGTALSVAFHKDAQFDVSRLTDRVSRSKNRLKLSPAMVLTIRIAERSVDSPRVLIEEIVDVMTSIGVQIEV